MTQVIYRVYLVWFLVGFILVGFNLIPPWLEWANSMFLVLSGSVAVLYAVATFGKGKGIVLSVLIFVTTFLIEGLSAHFDVFFGVYDYTELFPPLLFGVPIGIGFAWITMIMAGHALTIHIRPRIVRAIVGGLYVLALDLILDPVAYVVKRYWIWEENSFYYNIPLSNFLGWFVIAFFWLLILANQSVNSNVDLRKKLLVVFWTIAALFVWVALVEKLFMAILVTGVFFCGVEIVRRWLGEKE